MVDGKAYVLLPQDEYDKLTALAKAAELPALPAANAEGNFPAVEYAQASLARKVIRGRENAGLTQRQLARLAGITVEHLGRIESGTHTPDVATVDKIDRALRQTAKKRKRVSKVK